MAEPCLLALLSRTWSIVKHLSTCAHCQFASRSACILSACVYPLTARAYYQSTTGRYMLVHDAMLTARCCYQVIIPPPYGLEQCQLVPTGDPRALERVKLVVRITMQLAYHYSTSLTNLEHNCMRCLAHFQSGQVLSG